MLPILFGIGIAAVIVGVASQAWGSRSHGTVPPALGPGAPQSVKDAASALQKGTATPELVAVAIEDAHQHGMTQTVEKLANAMENLVTEKIPEIVRAPNKPSMPVPIDPATKKTLWYAIKNSKGQPIVKPRFHSILVQFKALQEALGIKPDGDLGPTTLAAFKKATAEYPTAPQDLGTLAANAIKWTEIVRRKFNKEVVGGPFDSAGAWNEFVRRTGEDMETMIPKVREKLGTWIGKEVTLEDKSIPITLSGLLALAHSAGMRGAASWLQNANDREKYPHTTKVFSQVNGLF